MLEPIYPLREDVIMPYAGRMVCAVCKDGRYYMGKLANVGNGNLYFEGYAQGPGYVLSKDAVKSASQIKRKAKDVRTTAFFNPFFLPLASLAFLFAFPFFFFPFFI